MRTRQARCGHTNLRPKPQKTGNIPSSDQYDKERNMPPLLLNTNSVIMCPHGGIVTHVSGTSTSFRIQGRPPMLLTDVYIVSGCPFGGGYSGPCTQVMWVSGSPMLRIRGIPVLTQASVGICQSSSGVPQGPAIIASCQLIEPEPDQPTDINQ